MTVFRRYLLIQVPGWVLVAIILAGLHLWVKLPLWAAIGLYAVYVGKDFVLYPFLRRSYDPETKTGVELLAGETGTAEQDLDPEGYVRVRGELWRAAAEPTSPPIPQGRRVRVLAVRGMTLIVAADASFDGARAVTPETTPP